VCGDRYSWAAASLLVLPSAITSATLRSVSVRLSQPSTGTAGPGAGCGLAGWSNRTSAPASIPPS
jgi:hypothetical protein